MFARDVVCAGVVRTARMIDCGLWPRTARMNGKPKRWLYAAFNSCSRANSSGVQASRPAPFCSRPDSGVSSLRIAACPASSGCARISASCSSTLAAATTARMRVEQLQARSERPMRRRRARRPTANARRCRRAQRRIHRLCGSVLRSSSWRDHATPSRTGCVAIQCRAISMRRQTHTLLVAQRRSRETLERGHARRTADDAAVQADRQHLRRIESRRIAFTIQHVEGVLQIVEELRARVEALRGREAHVVRIERVGHDEMRHGARRAACRRFAP